MAGRCGLAFSCLCALALAGDSGCGQQCLTDADCASCGSGRCLGSDNITRICVDAPGPGQAPSEPAASPVGIDWPDLWAADMVSVTYNDFSDEMATKKGRFYYDFKNLRQRQDFGRTALVYVDSKFYFVAFGVACFYVETNDPLTREKISIPRPNFMRACAESKHASYVGRERVLGEWADHYTCSVDYDNQTIAFQSWHSLGLGSTGAGLPMALSAGDSKPTWQAPRLTTTWYSNVTTEAEAVPDSVFRVPRLCIPIPGESLDAAIHSFHSFHGHATGDESLVQRLAGLARAARPQLIV